MKKIKDGKRFNANSRLEIPIEAIEESIVNALFHRDYSFGATINIFLFKDRLEIISPGSLPNHLDVEKIKNGNSITRNPIVVSYGQYILPYTGIGSGIKRILEKHKNTHFNNNENDHKFIVTIY